MTPLPDYLLRPILENPADDLLRLSAADWWEENGETDRAEFVKLQIANSIETEFSLSPRTCQPESIYGLTTPTDFCTLYGREPKPSHLASTAAFFRDWAKILAGGIITYRRGFPSAVRLTMREFLGRECQRCVGGAIEFVPPCESCNGTGRTPGLAKCIGENWPVERVGFSDLEPWFRGHWYRQSTPSGNHPQSNLPSQVFDLLEGGLHREEREIIYRQFDTDDLAISALSDAAMRYMRGLAVAGEEN